MSDNTDQEAKRPLSLIRPGGKLELRKPIGSRLLGLATLHLFSSDAELGNFSIYGVPRLEALADELRECQLRERTRRGMTTFLKA